MWGTELLRRPQTRRRCWSDRSPYLWILSHQKQSSQMTAEIFMALFVLCYFWNDMESSWEALWAWNIHPLTTHSCPWMFSAIVLIDEWAWTMLKPCWNPCRKPTVVYDPSTFIHKPDFKWCTHEIKHQVICTNLLLQVTDELAGLKYRSEFIKLLINITAVQHQKSMYVCNNSTNSVVWNLKMANVHCHTLLDINAYKDISTYNSTISMQAITHCRVSCKQQCELLKLFYAKLWYAIQYVWI